MVPEKSKQGLSFWYQFKGVDGIQTRADQYSLNTGVKMLLLKKKVQLTFNVTDLLKSNEDRYSTLVNGIGQKYVNY